MNESTCKHIDTGGWRFNDFEAGTIWQNSVCLSNIWVTQLIWWFLFVNSCRQYFPIQSAHSKGRVKILVSIEYYKLSLRIHFFHHFVLDSMMFWKARLSCISHHILFIESIFPKLFSCQPTFRNQKLETKRASYYSEHEYNHGIQETNLFNLFNCICD